MSEARGTLVSIGVPTFNRPALLRRALDGILAQTYEHLEIVVSDNASPNPEVKEIIAEFGARDSRVRAFRQERSIGPFKNFIFVLEQARGDFFMWAADDDYIEPWFVERCLAEMEGRPGAALVAAEAQYFDGDTHFEFIAEGEAFRRGQEAQAAERVEHLLLNNYGNLVYGLFRTDALVQNSEAIWAKTALGSLNEISLLVLVAAAGQILVLPDRGLHKNAPRAVYDQVVWEIEGGPHPRGMILHPKSALATAKYHIAAYRDIVSAIELTALTTAEKLRLRKVAQRYLLKHFAQLIVGSKPKQRVATLS